MALSPWMQVSVMLMLNTPAHELKRARTRDTHKAGAHGEMSRFRPCLMLSQFTRLTYFLTKTKAAEKKKSFCTRKITKETKSTQNKLFLSKWSVDFSKWIDLLFIVLCKWWTSEVAPRLPFVVFLTIQDQESLIFNIASSYEWETS